MARYDKQFGSGAKKNGEKGMLGGFISQFSISEASTPRPLNANKEMEGGTNKSSHGASARMFSHAAHHGQRVRRSSVVKRKLDSARWQADALIICFAEVLPFGSMDVLRMLIDGVRFMSNFFLAVYLTTFLSFAWTSHEDDDSHFSDGMSLLTRVIAVLCFIPVAVGNTMLEPYISLQFALINTLSCVNPLLLGETMEYVHETSKMMDHVAFKILHKYMTLTDLEDHDTDNIHMVKELLHTVFNDWDVH